MSDNQDEKDFGFGGEYEGVPGLIPSRVQHKEVIPIKPDFRVINENFTVDELVAYTKQELGGMLWAVESQGDAQTRVVHNAIGDALMAYSRRCPMRKMRIIKTTPNVTSYRLEDHGYGVAGVDFLYQSLTVSPFLSSLLGVSPIVNMEGGDFAMFQSWRKSFMRCTSVTPKWTWDESTQQLLIYNPVQHAVAGIVTYHPRSFDTIRLIHKDWIKRFVLSKCKYKLGEVRSKFGDKIPSPGGEISLNGGKLKEEAAAELKDLQVELMAFQMVPVLRMS